MKCEGEGNSFARTNAHGIVMNAPFLRGRIQLFFELFQVFNDPINQTGPLFVGEAVEEQDDAEAPR